MAILEVVASNYGPKHSDSNVVIMTQSTSGMSAKTSGTTVSATGSFDGVTYYENNKIELYIFNSI